MYVRVLKRTCMCARVRACVLCFVFLLEFECVRGVYVCVSLSFKDPLFTSKYFKLKN